MSLRSKHTPIKTGIETFVDNIFLFESIHKSMHAHTENVARGAN